MPIARMHLYPRELPQRLRVEIAWSLSSSGTLRPTDLPERARKSPLDPPFAGGPFVDVLLDASAHAPEGAREARVEVVVGSWSWEAAVLGRRTAQVANGRVALSDPEAIDAPTPIAFESAFGGGVAGAPAGLLQLDRELADGHLHPRNPFGLGYRKVAPEGAWELPLLEDPSDLLDAARLERIFEEGWLAAPLPWCLDEVHAGTFPRVAMVAGMGPSLEDASSLLEVRRGYLASPPPAPDVLAIDPRFLQDAPPWAWLEAEPAGNEGSEVRVRGCLPRGEVFAVALPDVPAADLCMDGTVAPLELRLERLVLRPEAGEVVLVASADVELSRPFLPGVHRRIPIEVRLPGHDPIAYPTPSAPIRPEWKY